MLGVVLGFSDLRELTQGKHFHALKVLVSGRIWEHGHLQNFDILRLSEMLNCVYFTNKLPPAIPSK